MLQWQGMKLTVKVIAHDREQIVPLEIVRLEQRERARRAWKAVGYGMGAAVISLVLPILHFFLVPGFLIGTPIVAWKSYQKEWEIPAQEIPCSHCGRATAVKANFATWPLYANCKHCQGRLRLELAANS